MNKIVFVFLLALFASCYGGEMTAEDMMKYLRDLAGSLCDSKLKAKSACEIFNKFLDHVEKDHKPRVYELFKKSDYQFNLLAYALQDVMLDKLKTREEDNHKVALQFEKRVEYWTVHHQSREL